MNKTRTLRIWGGFLLLLLLLFVFGSEIVNKTDDRSE